jgi:transposase
MTQEQIEQIQELHCQAVGSLCMLAACQSINDEWGVKYYSRQYDKIMQDLSAMPKMEKLSKQADLSVDTNGTLIFTPENE